MTLKIKNKKKLHHTHKAHVVRLYIYIYIFISSYPFQAQHYKCQTPNKNHIKHILIKASFLLSKKKNLRLHFFSLSFNLNTSISTNWTFDLAVWLTLWVREKGPKFDNWNAPFIVCSILMNFLLLEKYLKQNKIYLCFLSFCSQGEMVWTPRLCFPLFLF